jgi:farnesyl diphosphate synthase
LSAGDSDVSVGFADALDQAARRTETRLESCLPEATGAKGEAQVAAAMRHAALGGGKRLRAFLVLEVASVFGADGVGAERVAAAVECLHAYSLVHDGLPCMDDDDLRRGKPTVHRVWDEATVVLAGDALQTLAFELLADPATHAQAGVRAELVLALARASGHGGMVGGQALDLAAEAADAPLTATEVKRLQALKTGALIRFAAEAGAILGQASEADRGSIRAYAEALGEAFQIADDLLDVTGTEADMGKRVGKDAGAGKATYIDILGVEGAQARAAELVAEATAHLAPLGALADRLAGAARFVVERRI